jgi:hypothetical protein
VANETLKIIIQSQTKGTGAKDAEKDVSSLTKAAKFAAGAFAAMKTAQAAIDFVKFGAQVQRQADALSGLARSAGTSSDAIVGAIQEASNFTIDRMTAMEVANRAMLMGVAKSPEEFSRLTSAAVKLGRVMGQDATKSIDDFVTAAARKSTMIADNLGLVVSIKDANRDYAKQLGKTTEELTAAEQSQAFLNEMLEAGEEKLAGLGNMGGEAATSIEQVEAAVADAKTGLAEMAAELLVSSGAADWLSERFRMLPDTVSRLGQLAEAGIAAGDALLHGEDAANAFNESIVHSAIELDEWTATMDDWGPVTFAYKAEVVEKSLGDIGEELDTAAEKWGAWTELTAEIETVPLEMQLESIKANRKAMDEWVLSIQDAALAQMELGQQLMDATDAQIAQAAINQLKAALDDGEISFTDYQTAVEEVQLAFGLATPESLALASNLTALTKALVDGEVEAGDYSEALGALVEQSVLGSENVNLLRDALNNLPSEISIDVRINQIGQLPSGLVGNEQHGTPYFPRGGLSWVGEAGPELVWLPGGARVWSAGQSQVINNNQQTNYNMSLAAGSNRQQIGALMDQVGGGLAGAM